MDVRSIGKRLIQQTSRIDGPWAKELWEWREGKEAFRREIGLDWEGGVGRGGI